MKAIRMLQVIRTDDEGNHRGSVSPCSLEALDQLLHLPYLNVLLRLVRLRGAHLERRDEVDTLDESTTSRVNLKHGICESWRVVSLLRGSKILCYVS